MNKNQLMSILKRTTSIFIFSSCCTVLQAQEQFLWKKDKFNSTGGILLDPTHALVSPNSWDINLIGVDVFIQNNYTYITKQALKDIYKESIEFGYNNTKNSYYFTSNIDIQTPSISIKLQIANREVAIGFFTRTRSMINGYGIDSGFNYNNFDIQNYDNPFKLGKAKISGMNWSEIGFNIAAKINNDPDKQWQLGLNAKYLLGFDAAYVYNNKPLGATITKDFIAVSDYDLAVGIASAYDFNDKIYSIEPKGKGVGADIGISYIKNKYHRISANKYLYDYKLNLTILDLGFIRFNGEKHNFTGNNLVDVLASEYNNIENPYHFLQSLSTTIYGNPTTSKIGNNFVIGLPTALSFGYQQSLSATQ